jgi:hypothetical protein
MARMQALPTRNVMPPGPGVPVACFGETGMHTCIDRVGRVPLAAGLFGMVAAPDCRADPAPRLCRVR